MGLPKATKEEVIRLLKEGKLSKRAIHRQTKVSRVTIDKIEHSLLFPEKRKAPPPPKPLKDTWIDCPDCGKKLLMGTPCLTCSLQPKPPEERDWLDQLLFPGG